VVCQKSRGREDQLPRPTKSEIERLLLSGQPIVWTDGAGKGQTLQFDSPKQRRLFSYLLGCKVRQPTGLPQEFVDGLQSASEGLDDPASSIAASTGVPLLAGPWRLHCIETSGFGGLNSWNGGPFKFEFEGESFLLDGPNGSGKSSLVGAMIWALTGERPRDQSTASGHEPRPVFSANGQKPVGEWPPVACYPPTTAELQSSPVVSVKLTFVDPAGTFATAERRLSAGQMTLSMSEGFHIPPVLIETGLSMPARLWQLRLDEGEGRLTDAVQALTGLDDLVAIGTLAEGLCHKSREYRSYRSKELVRLVESFGAELETARTHLRSVNMQVPDFSPEDTDNATGPMAQFGKELNDRAAELASVVANDLKPGLDLSQARIQADVIANIASAQRSISLGMDGLKSWLLLKEIATALGPTEAETLGSASSNARKRLATIQDIKERADKDNRFRLKALGAEWHVKHGAGAIEKCPLCELDLQSRPELVAELDALRSAGEVATRAFEDNINALVVELENAIPQSLRKHSAELLKLDPAPVLASEARSQFVEDPLYADCLIKVAALVEKGLENAPDAGLSIPPPSCETAALRRALDRIAFAERLIGLAGWFNQNSKAWLSWWDELSRSEEKEASEAKTGPERILSHLGRLSEALEKSGPYRHAAEAMRKAWKAGKEAAEIQKEVNRRNVIAENLQGLKLLGSLCESVARDAINGLSGRISKLLDQILITEQLQYQKAVLDRKEGLIVQAGFSDSLRIDATLVANSSWLRAVLWSFVFSLREEAIEQAGRDAFPLLVLDDPQQTFDVFHRARWANHIAGLQNGPSKMQVIIATYDEAFIDLIKVDGVAGRQALISASGPSCDHVSVLEGAALERAWAAAVDAKTPAAAVEYIRKVRVHLEGLLKLMFRGEEAGIRNKVVGDLRDLLQRMHEKGRAPWDALVFATLLGDIKKQLAAVQYIEGANHTTGANYGMGEASKVHEHWKKLGPVLDRAFRTAREHRLLHGGMTALFAEKASAVLPEGHKTAVASIPLTILGRAAALTDGRIADGHVDVTHFAENDRKKISLGNHAAYKLTAPTLEPVARSGDFVLIKEFGDISNRSLVVALHDERLLARRLEMSANHSDIAALTAQAINPRAIAAPVIVHKGSIEYRKIVGVLFAIDGGAPTAGPDEVCDCGGSAALSALTRNILGLVQVDGQSAEPIALDKQYLIIKASVSAENAGQALDGKPVIAEDSDGNSFFKRLRVQSDGIVVLESLDSGGEYPPIVLSPPGSSGVHLKQIWPVAGILFELPK